MRSAAVLSQLLLPRCHISSVRIHNMAYLPTSRHQVIRSNYSTRVRTRYLPGPKQIGRRIEGKGSREMQGTGRESIRKKTPKIPKKIGCIAWHASHGTPNFPNRGQHVPLCYGSTGIPCQIASRPVPLSPDHSVRQLIDPSMGRHWTS